MMESKRVLASIAECSGYVVVRVYAEFDNHFELVDSSIGSGATVQPAMARYLLTAGALALGVLGSQGIG
jgi:hypothetical protein